MGERVIAVQIDAVTAPVLDLKEHPVIILRAAVDDDRQPADFFFDGRIIEAQRSAILRVARSGAASAGIHLVIRCLLVEEAVTAGVADSRHVDRWIESLSRLDVY